MVNVKVLRVQALLQTGIMMLEGISMNGVVEKVGEIRVQVEQRSADKAVDFERIAVGEAFAVIARERP